MPLHNTEDLKAGPTSQLESEALNEKTCSYEFPDAEQDPQAVYQTIHDQLVLPLYAAGPALGRHFPSDIVLKIRPPPLWRK